jgi:hypothetical protein
MDADEPKSSWSRVTEGNRFLTLVKTSETTTDTLSTSVAAQTCASPPMRYERPTSAQSWEPDPQQQTDYVLENFANPSLTSLIRTFGQCGANVQTLSVSARPGRDAKAPFFSIFP